MKYCTICGKPMGWQGTITFTTAAGTTRTSDGIFGLSPDMCLGHYLTTATTAGLTRIYSIADRHREPVPQAFQDAFDKPLQP